MTSKCSTIVAEHIHIWAIISPNEYESVQQSLPQAA